MKVVGQIRLACSSAENPSRVTIADVISGETRELPITKVKGPALERGMQSKRLLTLQVALIYLGDLEPGSDDGRFGQTTRRAVPDFQLDIGLNGTGVSNERTIGSVNNAIKAVPAD